mmetsp:Transcript_36301/g.108888  ORF Transcript_36301/g.108888 Transcript_36301/m.108888 type:complete len:89 (+) Transcript_36301:2004-2270(+)
MVHGSINKVVLKILNTEEVWVAGKMHFRQIKKDEEDARLCSRCRQEGRVQGKRGSNTKQKTCLSTSMQARLPLNEHEAPSAKVVEVKR